jgi:hypothetical protein
MLYESNIRASPFAEFRENQMGFQVGDTGAQGFSQDQRNHLLGQCTDINAVSWMVATNRVHNQYINR